ncbi:MAG: carbon-nitrogen family hydrolase [Chloroflexota bacterium]|nr:carbon-nitrogen family hydrolase [Chloroflexota bacterium]
MMRLTISLAQISPAWGKPELNLARTRELVIEAGRRGSDLVLFPELWLSDYDLANAGRYASAPGSGAFVLLSELTRQSGVHLLGSILEEEGERKYNTAVLFAPNGDLAASYRKTHLFAPMEEARYLVAGETLPVFDLPWGRCALAICYDLRFPEVFARYADAGARIVFLVAQWPQRRRVHWQTLVRARAIENQMFVVACNRVGEAAGERFGGHSVMCDPWGRAVVEAGEDEVLLTATIDLGLFEQTRKQLPFFADRRPELYKR